MNYIQFMQSPFQPILPQQKERLDQKLKRIELQRKWAEEAQNAYKKREKQRIEDQNTRQLETSEIAHITDPETKETKSVYNPGVGYLKTTGDIMNETGIADFIPVVGDVKTGSEAVQAAKNGDYSSAIALAGLALIPNAIETPMKAYRKLTHGQINKILLNSGRILPNNAETKGLTLSLSKPRKAEYYIQMDEPFSVVETLQGASYSPSPSKPLSNRVITKSENTPLLQNNILFKKVNGKYVPVDLSENYDVQALLAMEPSKSSSLSLQSKRNGTERKISDHEIQILSNPRTDINLKDTYIIPGTEYHVAGISHPEIYKSTYPYLVNQSNATFTQLPFSKGVYATSLKQTDAYNPIYAQIRTYIQDYEKIDPIFNSAAAQGALLSHYKNNFGIDLSGLSENERVRFMSKLQSELPTDAKVLFHSTQHPITEWDPSKLGSTTGNSGFYGRGLYLSDIPTQDYGPITQPIIVQGANKPVIISREIDGSYLNSHPKYRLHSPQQDVDDLLADISYSPIRFNGTPSGRPIQWPLVSKDFNKWNKFLKTNNVDIIYAVPSSKGSGVFSEILLPESTSARINTLFPRPEQIQGGQVVRDFSKGFMYKHGGTLNYLDFFKK